MCVGVYIIYDLYICRLQAVGNDQLLLLEGTPKRVIQPLRKACATASAIIDVRGMASGLAPCE